MRTATAVDVVRTALLSVYTHFEGVELRSDKKTLSGVRSSDCSRSDAWPSLKQRRAALVGNVPELRSLLC